MAVYNLTLNYGQIFSWRNIVEWAAKQKSRIQVDSFNNSLLKQAHHLNVGIDGLKCASKETRKQGSTRMAEKSPSPTKVPT